jgi:hypothetical protein
MEPLVRFLEETPRERLLEEVGVRIRKGLTYREILGALLLAGVRNIQPRPVGFKFHAVLVVHSAHLASLASPERDRWLPIFWALDHFKGSQAQDVREGDWTLPLVEESKVPAPHRAVRAFCEAMEQWDEAGVDVAVAGLARSAGSQEIFELFCRYCARDFRELGHKAIYVANSWRTLETIGWQHAEPVLRSLAYALLDRLRDPNPSDRDLPADRPGRRSRELVKEFRDDWMAGSISSEATGELLETLREASAVDASRKIVELINRGVAPASIWDGLFAGAGELLMRAPGIQSLHAVTCTNALQYEWRQCANPETRKYLLLQAAAFLPLFRGVKENRGSRIDRMDRVPLRTEGTAAIDEIFADVSVDRLQAAGKALTYLERGARPADLLDAARVLIFQKGRDSHDYKFSSAVLEDFHHISPEWRNTCLAASLFNLRGSGDTDNGLVIRIREALKG